MEWTIKLEAKDGSGKAQTFDIGQVSRRVQGLTAGEIGLSLDEAKPLLAKLQRRIVETQIEEKIACIRVCSHCLRTQPIRDRRTRTLQTVFGTVQVAAPRIRLCACIDKSPFEEVSFSPLSDLLPDRCLAEVRRFASAFDDFRVLCSRKRLILLVRGLWNGLKTAVVPTKGIFSESDL